MQVAGGTVAEIFLRKCYGVEIVAWVSQVGKIHAPKELELQVGLPTVSRLMGFLAELERAFGTIVLCPLVSNDAWILLLGPRCLLSFCFLPS